MTHAELQEMRMQAEPRENQNCIHLKQQMLKKKAKSIHLLSHSALVLCSNLVICHNLLLDLVWHIVIFLKCHGVLCTTLGHAS